MFYIPMQVARAVDLSRNESINSGLPGASNGIQDAYRHILLSAELTRTLGENFASAFLFLNEVKGDLIYKQTKDAREMDEHNNMIGTWIGGIVFAYTIYEVILYQLNGYLERYGLFMDNYSEKSTKIWTHYIYSWNIFKKKETLPLTNPKTQITEM